MDAETGARGGARGMDRWSVGVIRWVRGPRKNVNIQIHCPKSGGGTNSNLN